MQMCFKPFGFVFCFRPSMRTGSSVILIALAVFDNLFLLLGLLYSMLRTGYNIYLDYWSEFSCKSYGYVRAIVEYSEGYLIVIFTIFRVISVYLPHKNNVYCTRKRAYMAVLTIILINCLIHLDYVINVQYYKVYEDKVFVDVECWFLDDTLQFFIQYYQYVLLCVKSLIPFTILIIGNCMIIFKLRRIRVSKTSYDNNIFKPRN